MVQFAPEIKLSSWDYPPKIAMTQEALKDEVRHDARMIQRAYDYFQSNIKAGNIGLPNSRCIKEDHLRFARSLEPVYKLEDCPDDDGEFPESWIKVSGAMRKVLCDFHWYAPNLLKRPDEDLHHLIELALGREAVNRYIQYWINSIPCYESYEKDTFGEATNRLPVYKPLEWERVEYKPFAVYEKFKKAVPYEPTKEELAETERVRKQSEACGTPSEQTARCYLFDLIDTSPSAREVLERQAREDPKAAYHIQLLKEKKKGADGKTKESESLTNSEGEATTTKVDNEIPTEVDDQKEIVRKMYSVGISDDSDKVFQMEREPWTVSKPRLFPEPVLTGCPTGILIDF